MNMCINVYTYKHFPMSIPNTVDPSGRFTSCVGTPLAPAGARAALPAQHEGLRS